MKQLFAIVFALCAAMAWGQVVNENVTQDNIQSTICVKGWTKTIRPPVSYTNKLKRSLMAAQGIDPAAIRDYELDHVVPLEIGGHPTDPANLQLQAWEGADGAHAKDVVETRVKRLVCTGHLTLEAARACIGADWHTCPTH